MLATQNSNVQIVKTINSDGVVQQAGNINKTEYPIALNANDSCYVVLKNISDAAISNVSLLDKPSQNILTTTNISMDANEYYEKYTFTAYDDTPGYYTFTFTFAENGDYFNISVLNSDFTVKSRVITTTSTSENYKVFIDANQLVYIIVERVSGHTGAISQGFSWSYENPVEWFVDNNVCNINSFDIIRGNSCKIVAEYENLDNSITGTVQLKTDFLSVSDGLIYTVNNGNLVIDENDPVGLLTIVFEIPVGEDGRNIKFHFDVRILADDAFNTAISKYNNQNGFGISVDKDLISSIEVRKDGKHTTLLPDANGNFVLGTLSYPYTYIEIISITYKYGDNANTKTVRNGTYGVFYQSIFVDTLFGSDSDYGNRVYKISCVRHLRNIAFHTSTNLDKFELTNDITLVEDWIPILKLVGTLDGKGYTISGLRFTIPKNSDIRQNFGLFEINDGIIKNLTLTDVYIVGEDYQETTTRNIGAVAGINEGVISNVSIVGTDNSSGECYIRVDRNASRVGGIAGLNDCGTIDSCNVTYFEVYGNGDIGGIAGKSYGGTITSCYTQNTEVKYYIVTTNRSVGGIVGFAENSALITYCYNVSLTVTYEGRSEIDIANVLFNMGRIVGHIKNSTVSWVSAEGVTFDLKDLPTANQTYIGKVEGLIYGKSEGSTISSTEWSPEDGSGSGGGGSGGGTMIKPTPNPEEIPITGDNGEDEDA